MSTVKRVEQALNTPASEPISAESSPATTMPRRPGRQQVLAPSAGRRPGPASGSAAVGTAAVSAGHLAALDQGEADHAGDDEQVRREQLEEAGEDAAAAGDLLVRGAQGALHDVLVGAPVPQADDRGADGHAQPGVVAVEIPGLFDDLAGGVLLQHRRPGGLDARRRSAASRG